VDFEPWWLIFVPVLFALGWIAARVDVRHLLSESRSLPTSYFKGLNFLLNEQPDRAIDAFVEVAKLDPETTELHFALGSLFRRRGEIERAIRVHQSLLARADLPTEEREHALHELAQNFLKAGMLDRAENLFKQLEGSRYALPALRALIRIYESEHDWARAIDAVRVLRGLTDEPVPQLVHYHCEVAQAALDAQPPRIDAAQAALDAADHAVETPGQASATSVAPSVARIAMLRAHLAMAEADPKRARLHLQSVLNGEPDYAGLVAEDLLENYRAAGEADAGLALLARRTRRWTYSTSSFVNCARPPGRKPPGRLPARRCARIRRCSAWTGCWRPNWQAKTLAIPTAPMPTTPAPTWNCCAA